MICSRRLSTRKAFAIKTENDDLCESLIVDDIEAEIEAQYQIPIDEVDLGTEFKILDEFDDLSFEKLKAESCYDPGEVKKLIDDLFNTVAYQETI